MKKHPLPDSTAEFDKMLTVSPNPHIRSRETTPSLMLCVIIALLPAAVWGVYQFGLRALMIMIVSIVSCVGAEALSALVLKLKFSINDLSAVVTGLLLALNLPVSVPLWMPAVGGVFAIVIVKQLFGGIGKNFLNPALCARVFLFSWAGEMTYFTTPKTALPLFSSDIDAVSTATPLASLNAGALPGIPIIDLFIGKQPGCIGEVSALLLLAGGLFLIIRKVISVRIPLAFIGTVFALTYFFPLGDQDVHYAVASVFSGALFLGAFFMATDYTTSPCTPIGQIIYGVGCGALTVLIRYFGGYPEGVSFAILIMNLFVWFIDKYTKPTPFGHVKPEKPKKPKKAKGGEAE